MTGRPRLRLAGALGMVTLLLAAGPSGDPVADAAMRGDLEEMRSLIAGGADVNGAQGDGMTALHWAAHRGDLEMARILVDAGASPASTTRLGDYTPLHLASRVGAAEIVGLLLAAGADVTAASSAGGATPLHFAAAAGSAESIRLLVAHGAEVDGREQARGQTPLIFAASYGRAEAVEALLEAGADPSLTSTVWDVPTLAEQRSQERRLRNQRLEEGGAATVGTGQPPAYGAAGGLPPPASAEVGGDQPPVGRDADTPPQEEPVDPGEPLSYNELIGGHGGLTPLLHAVREGHTEAALALLAGGAEIDQPSQGDGTTPMLMAMINGHFDLAMLLFEQGADPNLANDHGATPLYAALNTHWAPKARYPQQHAYKQQELSYLDVMRRLLDAGVDPNVRLTKHLWFMGYNFDLLDVDTRGATPFWRAAYATDVEAMRLLVAYGAVPGIPTMHVGRGGRSDRPDPSGLPPVEPGGPGVYPIHAASGVGYGEGYAGNAHRHVPDGWLPTVRYLVEELGADVNARDANGYTALHHAAARGDNELIVYLVEKGADVTAVSRRGQTTADMANGPVQRVQPFPETIALLEKLGAKNNHRCMSC